MPHSYLVTFFKFFFVRTLAIAIFLFSALAHSQDCSFGGAGRSLQFVAGTTTYDYDSANTYLYDCIVNTFKNDYVNAGNVITIKNEIKNELSLAKVVAGLKQGLYTESTANTPNSDRDILLKVESFARKVQSQCVKDSNYIASVNAMGPTSFSSNTDKFISHCFQISQLVGMTLSLDSRRTTLDPNLITAPDLREFYIQCETSAPALACQALCASNAPEQFKQIGCDQLRNKYGSQAIVGLAQQCVEQMNSNPSHESCQQLCNTQSTSCLSGLTAATDPAADPATDPTATADASTTGTGDTTDPTGSTTDQLTDAVNNAAQRVFGGGAGMGMNNFSNKGEVTSPTHSIGSSLNASSINGNGNGGPDSLQAQAANVLPGSAHFPINTLSHPGGTKKDGPPAGGGGPRGGGGGGSFSGGSGGGAGGSSASRGGRRSGSKNTKAEDIDLNRFMGTSGNNSNNSPSTLSQKLKDQIDKNKKIEQIGDLNKVNAAFRNGLNRGVSNSDGLLMQGQFFPEAEAAYEYIRNTEVLPNEKGHL